jgi:cardiolipin synthase
MYRDCEQAKKSIEFEQYILERDPTGKRFMELFAQKAAEGIRVFLICDRFGSSTLYNSDEVKRLCSKGGQVYFYNRINFLNLFTPWRWFPRTHIKTLLIDSQIAYTGGVCISDKMKDWRDTHMRVTGPIIKQIRPSFDEIESKILRRPWQRRRKKNNVAEKENPDLRFNYLMNKPRKEKHAIYEALVMAINRAERYVYITSAYFIPNGYFLKTLQRAHARGVEIIIIVPEHSDVYEADWVCLSYWRRFQEMGFRLFLYKETVLHSKQAIIDDNWATVGSTNFDVISFFYNREANITITDAEAIAQLKAQFFEDMKTCEELTEEVWRNIPLWKKAAGYSGRLLKAFFK